MGVTVKVLETATVVTQMSKELVIEPDVNPFPAALGRPSQLMPASYVSSPCKPPVAENLNFQFITCDTKPQRSQVLLAQGHEARKSWMINLPQLPGPSAGQLPVLAE